VTVYILRHAIAELRREGHSDAERALTSAGKQKLQIVLRRARQVRVSPALILTSPYKRALETAEMAAEILVCQRKPVITKTLLPSGPADRAWREIAGSEASSVLVSGHEPQLSELIAYLLKCSDLQLDLKKSALVRVDVSAAETRPHGTLKWILTPRLAGA
jgi:phosphohistidine phosphatase